MTAKDFRIVVGERAWVLLHMDTINNSIIQHEPTYFFTCQHQDRSPAKPQTALKSEQTRQPSFIMKAWLSDSFALELGEAGVSTV
jgi:hypothetical protein